MARRGAGARQADGESERRGRSLVFMHPLVRRVGRFLGERRLVSDGDALAVGVSGGADSVALALALAELSVRAPWSIAGLIHVHHGLRADADRDAEFVADLARQLSLPLDVMRVDVPALVASERRSVEVVAREARYRCFETAADRLGATLVATGHTLDDQAETVMLRLLRGAGPRGLSAIRPRRGRFVRPLLECRRHQLRAFLADRGQSFREDPSNRDLDVPRNRLRHRVMPVIEDAAPGGAEALARFADLAAADEDHLNAQAQTAAQDGVRPFGDGVQMDIGWLTELPTPLARRVLRGAVERVGGVVTFRDVRALLALAQSPRPAARLDLHRVRAERRGRMVLLGPARPPVTPAVFEAPLPLPGHVDFGATGLTVFASLHSGDDAGPPFDGDRDRVVLQAGSLHVPLTVRTRRPGDRLRPLGAPGVRKLQDILVDRKVPRAERDRVPVVVDAAGRIVWVAGVAMAHGCRVTAPEAGMVILKLERRGT